MVEFEPTGKVRLWSTKSQKLDKEPLSYRAASLLLPFETKNGENLGVSLKARPTDYFIELAVFHVF